MVWFSLTTHSAPSLGEVTLIEEGEAEGVGLGAGVLEVLGVFEMLGVGSGLTPVFGGVWAVEVPGVWLTPGVVTGPRLDAKRIIRPTKTTPPITYPRFIFFPIL